MFFPPREYLRESDTKQTYRLSSFVIDDFTEDRNACQIGALVDVGSHLSHTGNLSLGAYAILFIQLQIINIIFLSHFLFKMCKLFLHM